jgi:hypothetical protein
MNTEQLKQTTLKPQDVAVLLALHLMRHEKFTFAALACRVGLSKGEVHASVRRAALSRLALLLPQAAPAVIGAALREFLLHGMRYAFPAIQGGVTRGMLTGLQATEARGAVEEEALPPVWAAAEGAQRGYTIAPLYPAAPHACLADPHLHELLALVDAVRVGSAREREIAIELLEQRLS